MVDDRGIKMGKVLADELVSQISGDEARAVGGISRQERELAQRSRNRASASEILAGAQRVRRHLSLPVLDHGELLYDKHGLPK